MNIAQYVIDALQRPREVPSGPPAFPSFGLLDQIDSEEPLQQALNSNMGQLQATPEPMQPAIPNFHENTGGPVQTGDISNKIQEWLGAKEPDEDTFAKQALSQRFDNSSGPSFGDYSQAIQQSAYGKPTNVQEVASAGLQNKSLLAMLKGGSGGSSVFAQKLALLNSDPATAKLPDAVKMSIAAQNTGAGTYVGADGVQTIPGAVNARGGIKFGEARGTAAGKASIEMDTANTDLSNLDYSISQARDLIPKVALTGPVLGRVGNAANDPDYANLQGALNGITLQAKELYNLGSGQGFSDADRDFLGEVIAGKYSRAETIGLALDRMEQISKQRQAFLAQRQQGYGQEFGYQIPQPGGWGNQGTSQSPAPQISREDAIAELKRRGKL